MTSYSILNEMSSFSESRFKDSLVWLFGFTSLLLGIEYRLEFLKFMKELASIL